MNGVKNGVKTVMRSIARVLNIVSGGHISPNMVTITGLLAHIPIAYLIATSHNYKAAGLLVVFGLFDSLDGELARLQKRDSPAGMLLDSVTDRMKEIILYIGMGYAIIEMWPQKYAVWVIAACGTSILVSYINAWGEAVMARHLGTQATLNKAFRGGILSFEVRMLLIVLALLANRLDVLVVVITLGASCTVISRLVRVLNALKNVQN